MQGCPPERNLRVFAKPSTHAYALGCKQNTGIGGKEEGDAAAKELGTAVLGQNGPTPTASEGPGRGVCGIFLISSLLQHF